MSRRRFLQTGAAATFGLGMLPASARAVPAQRDPYGGFLLGVQSYSFRNFGLEQALQRTRDLGLHFIELCSVHLPLSSTPTQIAAARNLCFQYDITPIAFGVESFGRDHDANRRKFDFARALGIRFLSADPDPDSFDSLDRLVQEYGIGIAIHPHGPQGNHLHRWYSAEVILAAVRDHHRLIGTCLDTGHLIRSAQPPFNRRLDPAAQIRAMGDRNYGLHLKDHDNRTRRDVVFGRGVLDIPGILRALREVHFQGYLSIEYEAEPQNPSPEMRACVEVFRNSVATSSRASGA
jgi:sugar phosphate isomerase/epimerase